MGKDKNIGLSEIKFHLPQSLRETFKLLADLKEVRVAAGGTDLLVDLKQGLTEAKNIISLQKIKELRGIRKKNNKIQIGALTTVRELTCDPIIHKYIPVLAEAAKSMASYQIRSMATIGGNIASAVPSADLPPSLIAAEATLELRGLESSREVPLFSFFAGPRETICGREELLTFIHIPFPPSNTGISYQKFALRESSALAVASVAARITLKNGLIAKAAIVLGAVAPTPVAILKASEFLIGNVPSESLFQKAASIAKEESKPISDIRGSVWFRKELVNVLTRRALAEALKRAQGNFERGS